MVLDAALKLICKERQDSFRIDPDCRQSREEAAWPDEEASSFMGPPSKDLLQILRSISSAATSPTGSLKTPGANSPTGSIKAPGGASPKAAPVLQARPVESSVHSARSPCGTESSVHSVRSPNPRMQGRSSHRGHGRGGAGRTAGRGKSRDTSHEVYGDENRRVDLNVEKDQHRGSGKCPDKAAAQRSPRRPTPDSPLKRSNTDKGGAPSFTKDSPIKRSNTDKGIAQAYPSARSFQSPRGGYGSLQSPRSPRMHGPPHGAQRVTATPSSSFRECRSGGRGAPQAQAVSSAVHSARQSRAAPLEPAPSFTSSNGGDWPPRDSCVVFQPRGTLPPAWPATPQATSRQTSTAMTFTPQTRQSSFPSGMTSPSLSEFAKDAEFIRQKVVAELQQNPSFDSSVCHEISNELEREHASVSGSWQAEVGVLESLRDYVPPPISSPAATLKAHPARGMGGQRSIQSRSRSCSIFWRPPPEAVAVCENVRSPSFLLHIAGANGARENTTESAVTEGEDDVLSCQPKAALNSVCGSLLSPAYTRKSHRSALPSQISFSQAPPRARRGGA